MDKLLLTRSSIMSDSLRLSQCISHPSSRRGSLPHPGIEATASMCLLSDMACIRLGVCRMIMAAHSRVVNHPCSATAKLAKRWVRDPLARIRHTLAQGCVEIFSWPCVIDWSLGIGRSVTCVSIVSRTETSSPGRTSSVLEIDLSLLILISRPKRSDSRIYTGQRRQETKCAPSNGSGSKPDRKVTSILLYTIVAPDRPKHVWGHASLDHTCLCNINLLLRNDKRKHRTLRIQEP
jgi:hypothetical protein